MNILSVFNTCLVISLYFQNLKLCTVHPWAYLILFRILPIILFKRRPKAWEKSRNGVLPMSFTSSPIIDPHKFVSNKDDEINKKLNEFKTTCSLITTDNKTFRFKKQSSLYNFDKLKKKCDDGSSLNEKSSAQIYRKENKKRSNENYITLDNIEVTENLISFSRSVQYIAQLMRAKSEMEELKEDWRFVAAVLDRLLLLIFGFVTLIGTYYTLFNSPYIFANTNMKEWIGFK